jgi:hypothetical protein
VHDETVLRRPVRVFATTTAPCQRRRRSRARRASPSLSSGGVTARIGKVARTPTRIPEFIARGALGAQAWDMAGRGNWRVKWATVGALCSTLACSGKISDGSVPSHAGATSAQSGAATQGGDESSGDAPSTQGGSASAGAPFAASGTAQAGNAQGGNAQAGNAQGGTSQGGASQAGDAQCIPLPGGAGANCQGGSAGAPALPPTLGQPCQNADDCTYRAVCDVHKGVCVLACRFWGNPDNDPTLPCEAGQICVEEKMFWPFTCYDDCTLQSCASGFACRQGYATSALVCVRTGSASLGESCSSSMISTGCSDPNASCSAGTCQL